MAATIINMPSNFDNPSYILNQYPGDTLLNSNGYSGTIELVAGDPSIPKVDDTNTPAAGDISWMGTLQVGNVGSGTVNILIATNSTDVGPYNFSAATGVKRIFFYGSYDSISMSSYDMVANNSRGEALDLSGTTIYTYGGSSAGWQVQPATIFGTDTGNDTFTGSAGTNVLYEGAGNSEFHQSAGNDLIDCSGGDSVYYATDAATHYAGGWQDSSGNTYLNNGSTWLFTEDGKTIELVNVPTVSFGGVTYTDATNNPTPISGSSSSTIREPTIKSSEAIASTSQATSRTASTASTVDPSALMSQAALHHSMLSDFSALSNIHGLASRTATAAGADDRSDADPLHELPDRIAAHAADRRQRARSPWQRRVARPRDLTASSESLLENKSSMRRASQEEASHGDMDHGA